MNEQEMQTWDWAGYRSDQLQNAIETLHDYSVEELLDYDDIYQADSGVIGRVYLGTVFELAPSGKYYTPWANGNVEGCETCDGSGEIDNPKHDIGRYKLYTKESNNLRMFLYNTYGAWCNGEWPKHEQGKLAECDRLCSEYVPTLTCPDCNGLGSSEVYQDELYNEALEQAADEHDMWSASGEGDPCDVFLERWVSVEEIVGYLCDQVIDAVDKYLGGDMTIRDLKQTKDTARTLRNKLAQLTKEE